MADEKQEAQEEIKEEVQEEAKPKGRSRIKEKALADDDIIKRAEIWFKNNQRTLIIVGGAIVVLVGGLFAWRYLEQQKEAKAAEVLYNQEFFVYQKDSFRLAAMGGDIVTNSKGLVSFVSKHEGTDAHAIGQYMLGMSYLHLGPENPENYQYAINTLKKVDFGEEEKMMTTQARGAMGDAYLELGDLQNALNFYEKAAKRDKNELLSPYYWMKAAMVHEQLGNWSKALGIYKDIEMKYPDSPQAQDIDRYIGRAEYNSQ